MSISHQQSQDHMTPFTKLRAAIEAMYASTKPLRHACEVRYVARMPSHEDRRRYLEGVQKHRGDVACERLRNDVARLMGIIK